VESSKRTEPSISFDLIPATILPKKHRSLLNRMVRESDQLLFQDKNLELACDRDTLIRMANDEDLVPPELRDIVVLETAKHLGRRVKAFKGGRRLSWREGAKYGLPVQPASEEELRDIGITADTSVEELGRLLKKRFPELPDDLTETEPETLRELALKNLAENQTVWDCLAANLGFWAALTLIGSIVIFLSLLTLGWQIALAVAIAYSGILTGYVIIQCLLNARYRLF
jgi:hypothetical protein